MESRRTDRSMRSARSQASVIRLVDDQDGNGEGRMFEFITPGDEDSDGRDTGPPRAGDF